MYNPASTLENETHKLRWDFDIQTDHLNSTKLPDLIIINKKKRTCKIVHFIISRDNKGYHFASSLFFSRDNRVELKENKKKDKYFDLARELKKLEHESDINSNCNWCSCYSQQRIIKGTGGLGNKRTSGDHPN